MGSIRRGVAAACVSAVALVVALPPASQATTPTWAPAATAAIHPGVQVFTPVGQCTSNFIFTDGVDVFLGQAAHCTTTGSPVSVGDDSAANGCKALSLDLGTPIDVSGAEHPGHLVYNSWLAMHAAHETDPSTCINNDFALIQLDPADYAKVNPSMPYWGGPTGLATTSDLGETVYSYGNSLLWLGVQPAERKVGVSQGSTIMGWNQVVYTVTPGVPGDSGSGFLDSEGHALGVLSTLRATGSNGVGMLAKELAYMHTHSSFGTVDLALGTEPFAGVPARLLP